MPLSIETERMNSLWILVQSAVNIKLMSFSLPVSLVSPQGLMGSFGLQQGWGRARGLKKS